VYSAFANGQLHTMLRRQGIDTIILTGSETDVCVLSSALSAVDLGYRVVVARDAVCSSADETHDALIRLYECRFDLQIVIAEAEEIVEAWSVGSPARHRWSECDATMPKAWRRKARPRLELASRQPKI
jgi:nicotinamidase-related amidase